MAILRIRSTGHNEQDARADNLRARLQAPKYESQQLLATAEPERRRTSALSQRQRLERRGRRRITVRSDISFLPYPFILLT